MRDIYYNSDITTKAVNEIKLLTLYYDKVNIVNDAVYTPRFSTVNGRMEFVGTQDFRFIPKSFESDYKLLIDEGIISITQRQEDKEDEYEKLFAKRISDLLNSNHDLIFPKHPTEKGAKIVTEEIYDIMRTMLDFEWGKPIETEFIWWYYAFKLKWFLKLLMEGQHCISSSNNLNLLFSSFINESRKEGLNKGLPSSKRSLAFDALKFSLPTPDNLSFEDVLELKLKLKDELMDFYQTINAVEFKYKELFSSDMKNEDYQAIFYTEIQKPLVELETKMKNLQSKTFRKFIERMQNPLSYAPLIGTVIASLPIKYTLLASLGLTAGQSYLEYKEGQRELQNNGLYFLLKLK